MKKIKIKRSKKTLLVFKAHTVLVASAQRFTATASCGAGLFLGAKSLVYLCWLCARSSVAAGRFGQVRNKRTNLHTSLTIQVSWGVGWGGM